MLILSFFHLNHSLHFNFANKKYKLSIKQYLIAEKNKAPMAREHYCLLTVIFRIKFLSIFLFLRRKMITFYQMILFFILLKTFFLIFTKFCRFVL